MTKVVLTFGICSLSDEKEKQLDDVLATVSHSPGSQNCEIECIFSENSAATACVVVYWKNESNTYGLVNFSTSKLDRNGDKANGYIYMADIESRGYNIAVFTYNNSMITGKPLAKQYIRPSERIGMTLYSVIRIISVLLIIM